MKFFGQTVVMLFSLALLGALGVGGYFTLKFLMELFASIDVQMAMVTLITSVVVLLAAKIIASSIREARRQDKAQQSTTEKVATYQQLIKAWEHVLRHECGPDPQTLSRHSGELQTLERLLILYGAPGVVKAYGTLQTLATKLSSRSPEVASQFAKVLMEMRQDLGSDTQGLKAEDLLQVLYVDAADSSERPKAQPFQDQRPRVSLASNT